MIDEQAAALAQLFLGVIGAGVTAIVVALAAFAILALIRTITETDR